MLLTDFFDNFFVVTCFFLTLSFKKLVQTPFEYNLVLQCNKQNSPGQCQLIKTQLIQVIHFPAGIPVHIYIWLWSHEN